MCDEYVRVRAMLSQRAEIIYRFSVARAPDRIMHINATTVYVLRLMDHADAPI